MASPEIHVRDARASAQDVEFIVAAFDSTLIHLAATGNEGQWGLQPFSEREGFVDELWVDIAASEQFRLTGQGARKRLLIAEATQLVEAAPDGLPRRVDANGRAFLPIGTITILDEEFASHCTGFEGLEPHIKSATEAGNFLYIDVLISDYRVQDNVRRGVGQALVNEVKNYALQQDKKVIFVDCWTGGTGKLVPYYERLGFKAVGDFKFKRKDKSIWPGVLFRLDIST